MLIVGSGIIILGLSAVDILEAIVRFRRPHYSNGIPSLALLLIIVAAARLICVAIVGYFQPD